MKEYFTRLFDYDHYASQIINNTVIKANNPDKEVKLMAHLLAAQKIWLNRCMGLTSPDVVLWHALGERPDGLDAIITNNYKGWLQFINNCENEDFDTTIHYKDTKGDSYENRLSDILAHIINHGTHHRAQIGQLLKVAGLENLPTTDYIFYLR